jgi:Alpha amylase, catalytic domain
MRRASVAAARVLPYLTRLMMLTDSLTETTMPTSSPLYPSLFQFNTRVVLQETSQLLGRPATLDELPDAWLDEAAALGFDWLWPLGVWQTGPAGRDIARTVADWGRAVYQHVLPDLTDADISGSPFAIQAYDVHTDFGGDDALARLRQRLQQRGLRLLLDFVPNHTALDHPWTQTHPEYYIHGTEAELAAQPWNYGRAGAHLLAHGRDPYFPGWTDTWQLNYRHPGLRAAMIDNLNRIADRCDGVRCDMAMLLLPDVIQQTWGDKARPSDGATPEDASFWPEAIRTVRANHPGFLFMAEAYWDREGTLQQQGFDYTYDKRLYDRLHAGQGEAARQHLLADLGFQRKCVRFLENHDEPRAAFAFPFAMHRAAAVVTFFTPGMRFFHEGQFEGRRVRVPMQVSRRPIEPPNLSIQNLYRPLLDALRRPEVRNGRWRLHDCRAAWNGNETWRNFIVFSWEDNANHRLLACVNYGPTQGQCYATLAIPELRGRKYRLSDLLGDAVYDRDGDGLTSNGLYLDMPAWGCHLFHMIGLT